MTEKEQHSMTQPGQTPYSQHSAEDDVAFEDLLGVLIRNKILILAITSFFTLFSIFYAKSMTPIYQATIGFTKPLETSESIKAWEQPVLSVLYREAESKLLGFQKKAEENSNTYLNFLTKVTSFTHQKKVFEKGNFLKKFYGDNTAIDLNHAVMKIHNSISITKKKMDPSLPDFERPLFLKLKGTTPKVLSEFLTALTESAKQQVAKEAKDQITIITNSKTNQLSLEINNLYTTGIEKKKNAVLIFSEALNIAKSLGIKNNSFDKLNTSIPQLTQFQNKNIPIWFLYGENAIQQELLRLQRRKNESIPGLAVKEALLKIYKAVDPSSLKVKVVTISQPSIPPANPIKPNKRLIIILGTALGLFVSIIIAFLRSLTDLKQKQLSDTSA